MKKYEKEIKVKGGIVISEGNISIPDKAEININEDTRKEIINALRSWLGETGKKFFTWCYNKYGTVSPVYDEGGIPHPVHFREGMQVRNYLRTLLECKDWTCEQLDDNWADLVKEALELE